MCGGGGSGGGVNREKTRKPLKQPSGCPGYGDEGDYES